MRRSKAAGLIQPAASVDHEKLKAALEQRVADWRHQLRAEPRMVRMLLRRLVGPVLLHDESTRPDFVKWETTPTAGLLDGLAPPMPFLVKR